MKHLTGLWIVLGIGIFFVGMALPSIVKDNADARAAAACALSGGEWTIVNPDKHWFETAELGCLRKEPTDE